MRAACLAAVGLLFSGQSLARSPEPFVRGEIVERVACAADPDQTYALYLPSGYDPARRWPILYLFDPGARGERAAGRFRKGAETYGFLLAASNNSENGPIEKSLAAARAVWQDTHARFSIDDRRVYSAGFSGGARVATLEAQLLSGSSAGVIGCGAGFPDNRPPGRDTPFDYFGIVGNTDFNYSEMTSLDATLQKLGTPHRLAIFEGPHQWPPEEVCAEALEWMRVREAARGVAKDAALVEASFKVRLARASAAEASGRLLDAHREYTSLARDFRGIHDTADAEKRISELEKEGRIRKLLSAEVRRDAAERAAIDRLTAKLDAIGSGDEPPALPRLLTDLEIAAWKKKAGSADREEALSARRVLEWLYVRASSSLPQDLLARKDFRRALLALTIATEIKPESPLAWYNRACGQARAGQRKKALEDLRVALRNGFSDRRLIQSDPDLASLRDDEEFRRIVSLIR